MVRQIRDPDPKERIVVAARRLVAKRGVHAASMRGIAHEAGVSTGAVTHYFTGKADVMTAVLRYNNEHIAERIGKAAAGGSGLAALRAAMEALLPLDEEMLLCWTVLTAFWGHGAAQQFVVAEGDSLGFRGLRSFVMSLLDQADEAGELARGVAVEHEAERIIALIGGIGMMVGGFPEQRDAIRTRARWMLSEQIDALKPSGRR
ncbi:MAG: TetR family transcriptional regulator [Actinophytocola sp.]|nr:TetR family transcriptional regulator [Actinophytocola sp.]